MNDKSTLHQIGSHVLAGVSARYAAFAVGVWTGHLLVVVAGEVKHKSSIKNQRNEAQLTSGTAKFEWIMCVSLRKRLNTTGRSSSSSCTRRNDECGRRASSVRMRKKWRRKTILLKEKDAVEAKYEFCSISGHHMCRSHVARRQKVYDSREGFPIPLIYSDVHRQATTSVEIVRENVSTMIGTSMGMSQCPNPGPAAGGFRI